ncbi:unnamed protein product [Closterium sp. NIES-54]
MTSLRRSGGSGDFGGGGSGSGGGRPSNRCGAVRWGVSGGGQMRLQQRQRESLTPQQLREWYTSRGGGGGSSGIRAAAVQLGVPGGGLTHLQWRPRETLTPQHLREWYIQRGASQSSARCPHLNLWPCVSFPETSPTLRWTGEVGDASVFRVSGSRAFVRDTSVDKLSARAIPCVFLGSVPDGLGWQFYHPTSRRVFPSQDVTFHKSVPFYRLFPYRSAPPPPPPLFLAPGPPPVDPLPPQGPTPLGVSQVDPLRGIAPVQVALGSGAAPGGASRGAEPGGAESEGAGSGGAEPAGVETGGVEHGGAESEGAESGGAEPRGAALSGGPAAGSPHLSPQQLRDAGAGGAGVTAGAGGAGGAATGPGGARTRGTRAAGAGGVEGAGAGEPTEPGATRAGGSGAGGAGAAGAGAIDPRVGDAGDTVRPRLYFVPLLQQSVVSLRLVLSHTARRVPHSCPPPVPGMHAMPLRPSSVPLRVPLPAPPESSLPEVPDPESDRARAASPTVARLLATAITDPSFESAAASALVV